MSITYCMRDFCVIEPDQSNCPVCRSPKQVIGAKAESLEELEVMQVEKNSHAATICSSCFAELPSGSKFCANCGNPSSQKYLKPFPTSVSSTSNVDQARFLKLVGICVLAIFLVWGIIKLSGNNNDSYNSPYITSADATVLGQSISNEINVDAVNRLIAGGIAANICDLSGTLQGFVDCIFGPIEGSVNSNDPITAAGEQVSAQPGGGLYITFTNLFPDSTWAQAALDEFVADAAAAESAGKTYQDYQG